MYNCEGPYMISQPQLSANYQIGHTFSPNNRLGNATNTTTGQQAFDKRVSPNMSAAGLNGGMVPNYPAYQYSPTRKVTLGQDGMPAALYLHQLEQAYGASIVQATLVSKPGLHGYNYGDASGDWVINAGDVTLLRRYIAHILSGGTQSDFIAANPGFDPINANVNGEDGIDAADVTLLRRYLAAAYPITVPLGPKN